MTLGPAARIEGTPTTDRPLSTKLGWSALGRWERPLLHGAIVASVVWVSMIALGRFELGTDARAYWLTGSTPWYDAEYGGAGSFAYSPAFGQVLAPLATLPWPIFSAIWATGMLVSLLSMGGRVTWALLLLPPVAFELYAGNIHLLLALAMVVGFRHPAAWSFVLLSKVTPGVGLLWFATRREWRQLAVALGVTAAIVAVSYLADPVAWLSWIDYLRGATEVDVSYPHLSIPLAARLPVSAVVVIWGAMTDRPWIIPVAGMIALPVIWPGSLAMLVAVIPLRRAGEGSVA